jgi:hypothetical protein
MGRKKLNRPQQELDDERRARQMKHYWKHAPALRRKNLERYHRNKGDK